jgi:hypothetical protein
MQVDFAVELGREDETLDFPWTGPEGGPHYYDLKRNPHVLDCIKEAVGNKALRDFLVALNAPASIFESAKCDTWASNEINPEEEIFGASWKFGSYVDFVFTSPAARALFENHEKLLTRLSALLQRTPEIPASAEFLLRRCRYHGNEAASNGFYVTFYLFGYGNDETKARRQWEIALQLVGNAVGQVSSGPSAL